jgi:hypothetical protein
MSTRRDGRWPRAIAAALALAAAAAGCTGGGEAPSSGTARVRVQLRNAFASAIARVTLSVSPGDGPDFTPIAVDLRRSGAAWEGFVTGIPAGPGRRFDADALDAGGESLYDGWAKGDVVAGGSTAVAIELRPRDPPPFENAIPVIDYLAASAVTVRPLGTIAVRVSAHDPDPGDAVGYRWASTCGTFDAPSQPEAVWIAPLVDGPCELSITVSDERGASASALLPVRVTSRRAVAGTRLVTYWPDPPAGEVTVPAPEVATARPPRALVREPSGGWTVFPGGTLRSDGSFAEGAFGADGSFAILDVPDAPYVLCYRLPDGVEACSETSADEIDLGLDVPGRPDQAPAKASTPVTLDLSGLDPWNPMEEVQVTSSGANLWDVASSVGDLRGGATSGSVLEDWWAPHASPRPLNLLAPPDVLLVHQLSMRSIYVGFSIVFYRSASRATPPAASPSGLALADGQAATIAAELSPLPLTATLPLDWAPAAFEDHRASLAPPARTAAGASTHRLVVAASPFALAYPAPEPSAGVPELVSLDLPEAAGPVAGELQYGRFLPAHWSEWRGVTFAVQVGYLLPGATSALVEVAEIGRRDPLPVEPGPILPAVSPVVSVRIEGSDAFADGAGVGETPTLSWSPPAVGDPTAYLVEVYRLGATGGATTRSKVLRYATRGTQVAIPPGVLERGGTYYASVTAVVGAVPYEIAPFGWETVGARARALTGTFEP